MSAVWDEDDTRTLLAMYREGMKTTAIGKALGRSKNAVCGQLKRLRDRGEEMPWRSTHLPPPGVIAVKPKLAKLPAKVSVVKRLASFRVSPEARKAAKGLAATVHILDAKAGQCRFIGGDSVLHCCGREADGGSWCADHKHVVWEGKKANELGRRARKASAAGVISGIAYS